VKIENGKIVEATEVELYDYWLTRGMCDLYTFQNYKWLCQENGTKITDEKASTPICSCPKCMREHIVDASKKVVPTRAEAVSEQNEKTKGETK
jgi:hypothetical protein